MDRVTDLEEQYDKIYRYCYFRVKHRERAEDITQETFLRFLESSSYRNNGQALRYLYTIARNLCIDEFRRRQKDALSGEALKALETGESNGICDRDASYERLLSQIAVKEALRELTEEERELLLLRYVNEVPVSVLSRLFGISRFAVYRKTAGALKKLREKLGEEDFT